MCDPAQYGPRRGLDHLRIASQYTFRESRRSTLVATRRQGADQQSSWRQRIGREFQGFIALVLAGITLGSGFLNLISVVGGASQPKLLTALFPLEFSGLSRILAILIGFALIVSSLNIFKRKKRAWAIVMALSTFSAIFHLSREPNYEEALLSSALLLLLGLTRNIFTVKSGRPDFGQPCCASSSPLRWPSGTALLVSGCLMRSISE
jgi:uncharacterized membrane protein YuzA (DUF378 family)